MYTALIIVIILILIVIYYFGVKTNESFISPYSVVYDHNQHKDSEDNTHASNLHNTYNSHFNEYDDIHSVNYMPNTRYGGSWPYRNNKNTKYSRMQGREYVVIDNGAQRSTYNIYDVRQANMPGSWPGRKEILVRFHYTAWNPKSKLIWPIWQRLKRDIAGNGVDASNNLVLFEEIDEQVAKTNGINVLPMIIKYKDGVAYVYEGPPEYKRMREWILSATDSRMYYFYPRRY